MVYNACMTTTKFKLNLHERAFLETVSQLSSCNPFSKRRLELERSAVGDGFRAEEASWNVYLGSTGELANVNSIMVRLAPLLESLRGQLTCGVSLDDSEYELYADLILFFLYHRYRTQLSKVVEGALSSTSNQGATLEIGSLYDQFEQESKHYLAVHPRFASSEYSGQHLFALAFQISRAFFHIYHFVIGCSQLMINLRARIWESIFSMNIRRYRKSLFSRMADMPTLITGPSGTGKELVARAVGLARYIPFDKRVRRFTDDFQLSFQPLNLSAFASALIESELFGHKRGSFTGAVADRQGWLARVGSLGTVFLDEIGELELSVQVKLLRVLESRTFQRIGDNKTETFEGKLIAATNRNLAVEIEAGNFRSDLFFRLCADQIATPSLKARIESDPQELRVMIEYLAKRMLDADEVLEFVENSHSWIRRTLSADYAWQGNVRELEQCLRNLLIHGSYVPLGIGSKHEGTVTGFESIAMQMSRAEISLAELSSQYLDYVYKLTGTYEETGRRVGLDRRTVKARLLN